MNRAKALSTILAAAVFASASPATAQLTEYTWDTTKTGSQQWQNAANWAPAGFPNDPLQLANLARPLGANLNVDIGTGVVVAGVALGATASPRTTEISSSASGLLTFHNSDPSARADFNSSTIVDGADFLIWQRNYLLTSQTTNANGDADLNTIVEDPDYAIWKAEFGEGIIASKGASYINSIGAAGSVNTISAGIHLDNEQLGINGNNNLTINGPLTYIGDANAAGFSDSALNVNRAGLTVTINGNITMNNSDALEGIDFRINNTERSAGKVVINGVISGTGDITMGTFTSGTLQALSTIELNGNNTYTGSIRVQRGNLYLGHDNAFGVNPGPTADPADDTLATFRPEGPANSTGVNIFSTSDARNIRNNMTLARPLTIKGDFNLTLSGTLEQTNNSSIINMLPAGKKLTLSGRINVWEIQENPPTPIDRRWEIDGTGETHITGSLRNDPEDSGEIRQLVKRGSGALYLNMAAGTNLHNGIEVIYQGNMHYATNDALPAFGQIVSYGGAIGVDTGVANNAAFVAMLRQPDRVLDFPTGDRTSDPYAGTGGLMLAASDSAATLDFTGVLAPAANMSVAAPEGTTPTNPYNFTGTIVPANSTYHLGGGSGTILLNGAQLSGAGNQVQIRNGGIVLLKGLNTYGGPTSLFTRYTSTRQDQAAADNTSVSPTQYAQVAPILEVNKLANGGQASSIGNSTSAAANLFIQGGTLKYVGAGDSTDRLFTVGTGGATIESSGGGALVFTNVGAIGRDDVDDHIGVLNDLEFNPNELYGFVDTSDIIAGMTVNDPGPGLPGSLGAGALTNRLLFYAQTATPPIPAALVTGVSESGNTLGININQPLLKVANLVFGSVPRTLTLSASLTSGANTMTPTISNSAAGSVVNISKTGAGTWILAGANTYTGTTSVQQGTLIVNGVQSGGGAYTVAAGATIGGGGTLGGNLTVTGTVDPGAVGALAGTLSVTGNTTFVPGSTAVFEIGGTGAAAFDQLNMTGTLTAAGTLAVSLIGPFSPAVNDEFDILDFTTASGSFALSLPNLGPGKAWSTATLLTTGTLKVVGGPLVAVPEPSTVALVGLALSAVVRRRRSRV